MSKQTTTKQYTQRYQRQVRSMLKNHGYDIENLSFDEVLKIQKIYRSQLTKDSYPKWIASNLARDESFRERGMKGIRNKAIKHLESTGVDVSTYSDDELFDVGRRLLFNSVEHGESIRKGIRKKYEDVTAEFNRRLKLRAAKFFEKSFTEVSKEDVTVYLRSMGFYVKDVISWKLKQVVKYTHVVPASVEEINTLYSEYLTSRFDRSTLDHACNQRYQTCWYVFTSGFRLFCRSSWEYVVCCCLNELEQSECQIKIFIPDSIEYEYEMKKHRYFPDIGVSYADGRKKIFEIKPQCYVDKSMNQAKFKSAKLLFGDSFVILTERVIFDNDSLKKEIMK